nr:carboxypeptidase-like regulatory domain-containing protein [Nonlabens ulvanivorans]
MKISLVLFLSLYCITCIAQRTITGTVTNNSGIPVLGATVLIKGTDNEVNTDFDGNYSIDIEEDDVLIFSSVGYETQEISAGKNNVINVSLVSGITGCYFWNDPTHRIKSMYGVNYKTLGIEFKTRWHQLNHLELNGRITTNLESNKEIQVETIKPVRINGIYIKPGLSFHQADFESNILHKYEFFITKDFGLGADPHQHIKISTGLINYSSSQRLYYEEVGYGIEIRKRVFRGGFFFTTGYTYWEGINEVELKGDYNIRYNWIVNVRYHHISNYEEVSLGISYNLRNW